MTVRNSSLTTGEQKKLTLHEQVIERGLNSFVDVGNALLAIQRDKLYTDVDKTFEGYCKKRWNFGKSQAYRYIDSAKVVSNLSPIGDISPPANEAQARVLAELPDEQTQANVWVKAVETAPKDKDGTPKVTAAHVKKVAEEVAPQPPKPKVHKATALMPRGQDDDAGNEVPAELLDVFEARGDFHNAIRVCREMAAKVKALRDGPAGRCLSDDHSEALAAIADELDDARPSVVDGDSWKSVGECK
jgi:hypothetical protein